MSRVSSCVLFFATCSCSGPPTPGTAPVVDTGATWSPAEVSTFFQAACVRCHDDDDGAPAGNMNLDAGSWYGDTVGIPSTQVPRLQRISPGDPGGSYLLLKLSGPEVDDRLDEVPECQEDFGVCGRPMGSGPIYPTASDVEGLAGWILAGAPQ